jgi:hypothetical protein
MPLTVEDVDTLQRYMRGVMDRAGHHAGNVSAIALALAGAIVWHKDPEPVEVREQSGNLKNVLWVKISGSRYAFFYNHSQQQIEMRAGTTRGSTLHAFTNLTPISHVEAIFRSL